MNTEYIRHGGCIMTRAQVYALESGRDDLPHRGIGSPDWWAFHPPTIDPATIDLQTELAFTSRCYPEMP